MQAALKIEGDVRLTKDPELRYTTSGVAVANLRVAGSRYTGKKKVTVEGVEKEVSQYQPVYITLTAWRERAERYADMFKKGDLISVSADLNMRVWNKLDGTKINVLEGILDKAILRSHPKAKVATDETTEEQAEGVPGFSEDVPF